MDREWVRRDGGMYWMEMHDMKDTKNKEQQKRHQIFQSLWRDSIQS